MRFPFVKTVLPESFGYNEPIAALVDVHSRGVDGAWMNKRAAAGVFKQFDIRPRKGHSIVHLIAMGDSNYYGVNRNGDGFLEKKGSITVPNPKPGTPKRIEVSVGNIETHDTFAKHAKVYRDHKNKPTDKSYGDVKASAHNDDMHRVELLVELPNDEWHDDLEKLASGGDVPWSMSCTVPFDICTECGNKAKNRAEYCDHARNHMTELTKAGNQIGVINDHMKFFDISRVRSMPADRIAYGLLKAASGNPVSGAELADSMTLFPPDDARDDFMRTRDGLDKLDTLRKLAAIEKRIEAVAPGDDCLNNMLAFDPEVQPETDDATIQRLVISRPDIPDVLGALADVRVSLCLKDFMRLVMGRNYDSVAPAVGEAQSMLPGIFNRMCGMPLRIMSDLDSFDLGHGLPPRSVRECISDMIPTHSLAPEPVQRRVTVMILRGRKPGMLQKSSSIVTPTTELAKKMAMAYAMYKLALCSRVGASDDGITELAVLQNYVPAA